MRKIFTLVVGMVCLISIGHAQKLQISEVSPDKEFDNVYNVSLFSDSLSSVFLIWIKQYVPLHKHAAHTEIVEILEGEGMMTLGDTIFPVSAGDHITIPVGTPHSVKVTSAIPMKVLSIQSPFFDGSDRIKLE